MSGTVAVPDKFLSFLPHRTTTLTAGVADLTASVMNPGFLTATGVTRNDPLQKIVNRRVLEDGVAAPTHPALRTLRFSLVDLTGAAKLASPQYAGFKDLEQGGLGSLAKTAAMWAAYQLKFDLEELAKSQSTAAALFKAARDAWDATQKRDASKTSTLFASNPKIELLGKLIELDGKPSVLPRGLAAPDLERIFDVVPDSAGKLTVRFKGAAGILVEDPAVSTAPHISKAVKDFIAKSPDNLTEARKLSFADRLFLMIDESDNAACHSCIENISFLYIASLLWQADIYSPARGGGLWEASTHDTPNPVRWIFPPVPKGARGADFVSATAASVAALFTLMEQGRLVNPAACAGMKQLTSKDKKDPTDPVNPNFGSLTRSFFEEGFRRNRIGHVRLHSKLGIGNFRNDGAIIVRSVPNPAVPGTRTEIRYVATGFDDDVLGEKLRALIVELDKCILENNGLITASTP